MKVGILSFNDTDNYGATLQEYALYYRVNNIGGDADIIRYNNPHFESSFRLREQSENILRCIAKALTVNKFQKVKFKKFKEFTRDYMGNAQMIDRDQLCFLNEKYDKFITGSDQVFNLQCNGNNTSYFLDFVKDNKKKYSYAASFGTYTLDEDFDIIQKYLVQFNELSIRESNGVEYIKKQLGIDAHLHLDPSLLLNKEEWLKLAVMPKAEKYILLYLQGEDKSIIGYAEKLAKEKKLLLYYIKNSFIKRVNAKYLRDVGPLDWLGLFAHARYIVTNSFHGIAFAINFNKQFMFVRIEKGEEYNCRIDSLLSILELTDRVYRGENKIDDEINYARTNQLLNIERKKAMDYLQKIIEKNE